MLQAFFVDTPEWKAAVRAQGLEAFGRAVAALRATT
jgi:hypothetical protein